METLLLNDKKWLGLNYLHISDWDSHELHNHFWFLEIIHMQVELLWQGYDLKGKKIQYFIMGNISSDGLQMSKKEKKCV